jgi:hypothetical protein
MMIKKKLTEGFFAMAFGLFNRNLQNKGLLASPFLSVSLFISKNTRTRERNIIESDVKEF